MHFSPNSKCCCVLLCALLSFHSFSQNRYVDPGGVDSGDCSSMGSPCLTITYALSQSIANDIINLAAGTYSESVTIGVDITLNGANAGTPATGTRGSESIINPGSNATAISVTTTGVTVDGVQIGVSNASSNATNGISDAGNNGVTIDNNIIYANSAGISLSGISSGTIRVNENSIEMLNLDDQTNMNNGSIGIVLSGLTGTVDAELTNNNITGASWGVFGYNLDNSSDHLLIDGGAYSGCTKGIEIDNSNGMGGFSPSIVDIQNVTMSGFTGPAVGGAFPDAQAGIYSFVGSATAADDVTLTVINADVSGVGNTGSDYSGIYMGGFATAASGSELNLTMTNSNIHDNLNRGVYVRGETTTANISQCTITGNGFDPTGTGGNPGFSVIVRVSATATVTNSTITNAAVQTSDFTAGLAADAATLTVTDCSITNNGNSTIARGLGGTMDLSRNWFGSTDEATILTLVGIPAQVDFTPAIGSGADTDGGTAGFQPDLSTLHVLAAAGAQTSLTRWQEGHDLVDASGTVVLPQADYAETVTVSKNVTFQPTSSGSDTSLDNLIMNGTGVTMTLQGNLLINNAVTFTDGNIDVASGELRLGSSASDISESTTSQITGMVTMDPRAVGTGTINLLGVNITGTEDLGNVTIARTAGTTGITPGGGGTSSIAVLWDITTDNPPAGNRNVTFTWLSDFDNGHAMNDVSIYRNNGSNWIEIAQNIDASGSNPRSVTANGVSAFSEWTVAVDDTPLPVELASFQGFNINGKAGLKWTTETEINADFFEIQKSQDGVDFNSVDRVMAAGNSNVTRNYNWSDPAHLISATFYRLRIVDFDGSFEYSSIVGISPLIANELNVFPNPAGNFLNVASAGELTYSLVDQRGQRIQSGMVNTGRIDLALLKPGVYFLKLGNHKVRKVIKE